MITSSSRVSASTAHLLTPRPGQQAADPREPQTGQAETNPRARSDIEDPTHGSQHLAFQRPQPIKEERRQQASHTRFSARNGRPARDNYGFSGGFAGPDWSGPGRLTGPDDAPAHLGIQS